MSTTLPLFWDLSAASKQKRIDASVKLIGALEQFQAQFIPKQSQPTSGSDGEGEDDGPSRSDELNALNATDVSYSIRRLIRGLASPRESSRLGFAVALTELLSRINTITCGQIVILIMDSTRPQGSMTGQEERDVLFARLFGLMSVIQSGLVVRTGSLDTSASSATLISTLSSFEEVIVQLVVVGEKKSWLRESAWFAIGLAIEALHQSEITWKDDAIKHTIELLFKEKDVWTAEKIALIVKLQKFFPELDWRKVLVPPFKNPDVLSTANLQILARILKDSIVDLEEGREQSKISSETWKPQLHFVWDIILDQLLPSQNVSRSTKGSFQEFFRIVVDESLFSATSSPQRKYWGFQVFQKALQRANKDSIPMLFTKNFMRSWINHLSNRDRYLHKIAQQTATEVKIFIQNNPRLGFTLILQLTGVNGNKQFDKLTKTKIVESVLTSSDSEGIKNYINYLLSLVDEPEGTDKSDIQAISSRRLWIIDQLGALIRNSGVPKDDEWVSMILDWLAIHGLFAIKKRSSKSPYTALHSVPNPGFSEVLQESCRTRLLSCLADLTSQTTSLVAGDKTTKIAAVASDGEFWISKVLSTVEQLESDTKHLALIIEVDEGDLVPRSKAREVASRLKDISSEYQDVAKGITLLINAMVLKNYCLMEGDQVDDDSLEAVVDAAERMFPKKKGKTGRKSTTGDDEHEPIDVLVDAIIGVLEKSTAYMRVVSNHVFSLLSSAVRETTVDLITSQLERRDPSELVETDEDADMDGEMEDEDESDEKESSESESDNKDQSADEGDEEENLELRKKIEEALRINGIEPATGDTDESEEELMDDDQMLAIDEQLAEVFRSRTNENKSSKNVDAQREATHFKNRVLDLVDTYLKKQPTNPLVIRIILPVVELIAGSSQDERQLSEKAQGILRSRIGKPKDVPKADSEQVLEILENLHAFARRTHSAELLGIISLSSLYLAKIMVQINGDDSLVNIYKQTLEDFMTRKNSGLNSSFFHDFFRRFATVGWRLRDDLLVLSQKAVNSYRQCQAFYLLEALVSQLPLIGDRSSEIITFMPSLQETILKVLHSACGDESTLSAQQVKDLFKFVLLAVRQTQRALSPTESTNVWNITSWEGLSNALSESSHLKAATSLQKMCSQVIRLLKSSSNQTNTDDRNSKGNKKRKATETEAGDASAEVKKTKRKKVKGVK
ncbi:DNA polymerase phi-domain-containing protein [Cyathus striatus]|nr:DNA polymerase phi-domain-containing protein [Cyathus striatus]